MAVCCYSGTVYDHGNKEMEEQIVRFVNQGKSKEEILNFYTDRYGEKVLALPKTEGFNLFAWIAPMMIAVLGFTIITVYINSKNDVEENLEFSKDNSIDYSDQIESDLKNLD
jgi:cytochrome c-type biogenesis protein CcmH